MCPPPDLAPQYRFFLLGWAGLNDAQSIEVEETNRQYEHGRQDHLPELCPGERRIVVARVNSGVRDAGLFAIGQRPGQHQGDGKAHCTEKQAVQDIFAKYKEVRAAATPEAQKALMTEVIGMAADQLFTIGLVQPEPVFGIARNNVRNVPDPLPIAGQLWFPAPYTAQMYFEGGANLP